MNRQAELLTFKLFTTLYRCKRWSTLPVQVCLGGLRYYAGPSYISDFDYKEYRDCYIPRRMTAMEDWRMLCDFFYPCHIEINGVIDKYLQLCLLTDLCAEE